MKPDKPQSKSARARRIAAGSGDVESILNAVAAKQQSNAPEKEPVSPRDVLEFRLAQIWENVLGVPSVGVTEDFFQLGGHSMLAIRVVSNIEKHLHISIPAALLLEHPTIEELAVLIREQKDFGHRSPVVAIRADGSKPPFFCVHSATGSALAYAQLSKHLGAQQPFYAFQSQGREADVEEPLSPRIEEMAALYCEKMREIQPHGPYFLGGWSMGGVVAFEMARQLQAQGQSLAILALFDTQVHVPSPDSANAVPQLDSTPDRDHSDFLMYWFDGYIPISREHLRRLTPDEQLLHIIKLAKEAGMYPPDFGLTEARRLMSVYKFNARALNSYVPQEYAGRITLFRTGDRDNPESRDHVADPTLGWGRFALEGVEVHRVPGNHYNLIHEPQVKTLAEQLAHCLSLAESKLWPTGE
jgi:thioesterase domain-containing protein/acyl carrier protein